MLTVFILRTSCRGKTTILLVYTAWTSVINDPEKIITKIILFRFLDTLIDGQFKNGSKIDDTPGSS